MKRLLLKELGLNLAEVLQETTQDTAFHYQKPRIFIYPPTSLVMG